MKYFIVLQYKMRGIILSKGDLKWSVLVRKPMVGDPEVAKTGYTSGGSWLLKSLKAVMKVAAAIWNTPFKDLGTGYTHLKKSLSPLHQPIAGTSKQSAPTHLFSECYTTTGIPGNRRKTPGFRFTWTYFFSK